MSKDAYQANLLGDIKSILLCTDCSEYSKYAVSEAVNLAGVCGTNLNILYVKENPSFLEDYTANEQRHMDEILEMAAANNVECSALIRYGLEPHEAIAEESRRLKTDIIVMGKHGGKGLSRLLMGSVTAKVIAYADCKVAVVPRDSEMKGETILLATDGSACSKAAEMEAIMMAKRCNKVKKLVSITVYPHEDKRYEYEEIVSSLESAAAENGVAVESLLLCHNDPYKAIVNVSLESGADLIIIGSHGRTGLSRLLMGSVSERVVALSFCPVLVVKGT
ncbi:MAG: universal stress protein [Nitrospirae bacterium YQR-1]